MSKYITMEEEALKKLCGAVKNLSSVSEALDDENLSTESTFSSVKIQSLIDSIPVFDGDADTLEGHNADYFAKAEDLNKTLVKDTNVTMISLGFEAKTVVSAETFMTTLISKYGTNAYLEFRWADADSGYVGTEDDNIAINGGILLLSSSNDVFPNKVWAYAEAVYFPTGSNNNVIYKIVARTGGTAGVIDNVKIFKYSDDDALNNNIGNNYLSLNGGSLDNGSRIQVPSSTSGVATLIDGEYITVDNANTNKSSTITTDYIDTPEVTTKKITMENGTISMPSTGLNSNISIKDDYLYASLYADGLYMEDSDGGTSTHVGASGISTPSLTVGGKDVEVGIQMTQLVNEGSLSLTESVDISLANIDGNYKMIHIELFAYPSGSGSFVKLLIGSIDVSVSHLVKNQYVYMPYTNVSAADCGSGDVGIAYLTYDASAGKLNVSKINVVGTSMSHKMDIYGIN